MEDNYRSTTTMDSKLRRERSNFKLNDSHTLYIDEVPVYMGPEYICDPNAKDPTKPVPGLFKILPKGLTREELVGMIIDFDLKDLDSNRLISDQYSRGVCGVVVGAETRFNRARRQPVMSLMTAGFGPLDRENAPHIYCPESGYLGNMLLDGIVFLDTGDVDLVEDTWVAAGTSLLTPKEIISMHQDHSIVLFVDNDVNDVFGMGGMTVDDVSGDDTEVTLTMYDSTFQIKISEDKTVQAKSTAGGRLQGTHRFYLQGISDD